MKTPMLKKVGKLAKNPRMAVTSAVEQEVMGPVGTEIASAGQVQGPQVATPVAAQGPAPGPVAGGNPAADHGPSVPAVEGAHLVSDDPDAVALDTACTAAAALAGTVGSHLRPLMPGAARYLGANRKGAATAAVTMALLLLDHPELAVRVDPAKLVRAAAQVRAGQALEQVLQTLLDQVKGTNRVNLAGSWKAVRDVYHTASRVAETDVAIAARIAPVQAVFQRAPRKTSTPVVATTQDRLARQAAARAAKAQQKADASRARAAALGAHPLAGTPATPASASTQGPAPVPASVYQGPAVNPQGPAPGR